MSEPPRFGTSEEMYELLKDTKPKKVKLSKLMPIMTAEMAAHAQSITKKPILVDKCSGRVTDGNHRFWETMKRGDTTIDAYVVSPYVQDYKDYSDGEWKIRLIDRGCQKIPKG